LPEQPSLSAEFPSSQVSEPVIFLSPHAVVLAHVERLAPVLVVAVVQVQPSSIVHLALHPSPSEVFPSSHVSKRW
jgi:hypothetical protein